MNSIDPATDLSAYTAAVAGNARRASRDLAVATGQQKNDWLRCSAAMIRSRTDDLLAANAQDIEAAPDYGLSSAQVDRLRLSPERLDSIAGAVEQIAVLPDPHRRGHRQQFPTEWPARHARPRAAGRRVFHL